MQQEGRAALSSPEQPEQDRVGEIMDGAFADDRIRLLTPVFVKGLDRVVALAARDSSSACALLDDSRVWCWGDPSLGQLGDGRTTASAEPHVVPYLADVVALSVNNTQAWAVAGKGMSRRLLKI
jgi:alpha-tubulin suppressor-like RCC1 family protein